MAALARCSFREKHVFTSCRKTSAVMPVRAGTDLLTGNFEGHEDSRARAEQKLKMSHAQPDVCTIDTTKSLDELRTARA